MAKMTTPQGVSSKVLSVGNKVAPMLGALGGWLSAPRAAGGGPGEQLKWIMGRLGKFKIADPMKTTGMALAQPESYPIGAGASAAIFGWVFGMAGDAIGGSFGNAITGVGRLAKNGGTALAINSLIASYIYLAQDNPHPKGGSGYGPGDRHTIDIDNPQVLETGGGYFAPPLRQTLGVNL